MGIEYYRYYVGFFNWQYLASDSEASAQIFMSKDRDGGYLERITEIEARRAPNFEKYRGVHQFGKWIYHLGIVKNKKHPLGFK